jgi:hypothetical protein
MRTPTALPWGIHAEFFELSLPIYFLFPNRSSAVFQFRTFHHAAM